MFIGCVYVCIYIYIYIYIPKLKKKTKLFPVMSDGLHDRNKFMTLKKWIFSFY